MDESKLFLLCLSALLLITLGINLTFLYRAQVRIAELHESTIDLLNLFHDQETKLVNLTSRVDLLQTSVTEQEKVRAEVVKLISDARSAYAWSQQSIKELGERTRRLEASLRFGPRD